MAGIVGQAFVQVEPVVTGFRQKVAAGVTRSLGTISVPVPVTPAIAPGAVKSSTQLGESFLKTSAGASALRASMLGLGAATGATIIGFTALGAGLFTLFSGAKAAIQSAANLEAQLNLLKVVGDASADEIERVGEAAKQLGADLTLPGVSAGDAAAAMTELAKAGLSVDTAISAARGTLQLAVAANLDLGSAAELVGNALNAFQLAGNDATEVANLLAGASIAAQGEIADFGLALSQAAAVANQAGLSISATTTFLTLLAKSGIQGSDAGTSLRTALLRLIAPTNQAQRVFKELSIEVTDAQGNIRTDVFDQLRRSLERVEPATRNAALAMLFGADAVRAAAVFVRNGARGFDDAEAAINRAGAAADITAAKAEGLSGAVAGLQSNVETLGTTIGSTTLPALTDLTTGLSELVGGMTIAAEETVNLVEKLGDLGGGRTGKGFARGFKEGLIRELGPAVIGVELLRKLGRDSQKASKQSAKVAEDALRNLGKAPATLLIDAAERANLDTAGEKAGSDFGDGISRGIKSTQQRAVTEARTTLSQVIQEGRRMVADAIRAGDLAVQAAAFDAKRNLVTIGGELAGLAGEFIDTGPLGQRIAALQARLDISQTGLERNRLRRDLRDARQELEQAEQQIALRPGQRLTAQQRAGVEQFIRPFREKVKDAQAALQEFSTEGVIDKLQKQADQQRRVVQRGLDDLVAQFNTGKISLNTLNRETIELLRANIPGFGQAGKDQGFAFRQQWIAQLNALKRQASEIVIGPQTGRTGFEPNVVSPSDAARQAARDVADAQKAAQDRTTAATRNVKDAVVALQKTEEKNTDRIVAAIRRQIAENTRDGQRAAPQKTRGGGR